MAENEKTRRPRARAVIVERSSWLPQKRQNEFKAALSDDLGELVSAMGLAHAGPKGGAAGADVRALVEASRDPVIVFFTDVAALPPLSVEGALDSLKDYPCVLGPCADGGIYLAAFSPQMSEKIKVAIVEAATVKPEESLAIATDLMCDEEVDCAVLPPWFRIACERDFNFAENLSRLSLLSDEGDDDFVCDRLRLWFEQSQE